MGGFSSGRPRTKGTIGNYLSIDVRRMKRDGCLVPDQSFIAHWECEGETVGSVIVRIHPDHVVLSDRCRPDGQDWVDKKYPVYLDWTPCHLGGQRPWFICPNDGCGRRVAILYGCEIFCLP